MMGLTERVGRALGDRRRRVHGLALGYEDRNDHDARRHDEVVQTAGERDAALVSASNKPAFVRYPG